MSYDIHPAEVAALISYDPVTGKFHWKPRPSPFAMNTIRAAKVSTPPRNGGPTPTATISTLPPRRRTRLASAANPKDRTMPDPFDKLLTREHAAFLAERDREAS